MKLTHTATRAYHFGIAHPIRVTIVLGIVLIAFFYVIQRNDGVEEPIEETSETQRTVEVSSVGVLSARTEPIVVVGEVRSASQAELRAQKSGQIINVYARPGQFVQTNTLIAEVENAQERAMLEVARAGLSSAEAQLAKVRAGARPEERVTTEVRGENARSAQETAEQAGRVVYLQAYAVARNAVFTTADTFFTNAYTVRPSIRIRNASYTERTALEMERVALAGVFETWETQTTATRTGEALDASLTDAFKTLERVQTYIRTIQALVSKQEVDADLTASEKSSQESLLASANTSIDATKSALTGALASITQARTEVLVSKETERTILVGARDEDIALAEASVAQARGSLRSAEAVLALSQVRTPIAGTLSTLNISRGDFVSAQQTLGVVANKNTQEVEVYVSDSVRSRIQEGMPVLIKGSERGTVSNVSPGLDPVTKKARVLIRLSGDATLVQGAYVEVAFLPEISARTPFDELYVPLSAIKVTPEGLVVFTVEENGVLSALPITEGPLQGSQMRISTGLSPDTRIVKDVRGLRVGDVVTIAEPENDATDE